MVSTPGVGLLPGSDPPIGPELATGLVDVETAFLDYGRVPGQSVDDLLLDGMHPNDRGHALIAELLTPAIREQVR
ncbi:MAG: hypothetical protein R3F31_24940 [Verrucomicrobiales bacterium]